MGLREDFDATAGAGGGFGGEEALSQLTNEAAAIGAAGKANSEVTNQRNELLWKITAQIDDTRLSLEQLEETEKRLKKHLSQLESLRKILAK